MNNKEDTQAVLQEIKEDVSHLRKDIDYIKAILLPEEDISEEERTELDIIEREMLQGKKIRFRD